MTPDVLDWDAFEQMEKSAGANIPPGTVSITLNSINYGGFQEHFVGHDWVEVYYQPTAILLVPSDNPRSYKAADGNRSVHAVGVVKRLGIEKRYYPAKWVEGKGLLIDLRPSDLREDDLGGLLGD